ncbi:hypothetical protein [Roseococcus sp.]|uniref:hypothetical protein n=1 Tax=Roseococcus sp. TaxID=2109646 RepID=UPI003BA9ECC7
MSQHLSYLEPTDGDLDAILDRAFAHLDEVVDLEEGLADFIADEATPVHFEQGGIVHRFSGDRAVQNFCAENYLSQARIGATGKVTAYCSYSGQRYHIGWIQ